jgi:hypothetical protein
MTERQGANVLAMSGRRRRRPVVWHLRYASGHEFIRAMTLENAIRRRQRSELPTSVSLGEGRCGTALWLLARAGKEWAHG